MDTRRNPFHPGAGSPARGMLIGARSSPLNRLTGPHTYGSVMSMPDTMTSTYDDGGRIGRTDVLGVQRRRRWTPEEKIRIVEETYLPGHSVSLVARRHGIAGNQLFAWRRLMAQGALTAAGAGEEVMPASQYRSHRLCRDDRRHQRRGRP